jgi:DNA-binding transcriptional LysR family regulator
MAKHPYDVLDLKSLRCFFAVAKHGSLTRAGIELDISEAAVSQRIKALERDLGSKLYEARGGQVRLTPAGEHAHAFAISLFDQVEGFEQALAHNPETGEIVLSTHDEVLRHLLPDVIEKFARAHPLARLRLLHRTVKETVRLLMANEADLGVLASDDVTRELEFHLIATHPAFLLTSKGHPLARRARIDFDSLLNEETVMRYPLIVAEVQMQGSILENRLARLKLPLNVGMEVGTFETLKHYVARGLGIALVSGLCVTESDRAQLEAVEVPRKLDADTRYGVVWRRGKHIGPLLKSLVGMMAPAKAIPAR